MKVLNVVIDSFWVVTLLWTILTLWMYSRLSMPVAIKDILYGMSALMDYWLIVNGILGTIRFVFQIKNR